MLVGQVCFAQEKEFPSLKDLDRALERSAVYQSEKEDSIAVKKARVAVTDDKEELFGLYSDLHEEYSFYQVDSALNYSYRMLAVANELERVDLVDLAKMAVVGELIQEGLYTEAGKWLEGIDRESVPDWQLSSYFYKFNALYEALSDFSMDLDLKYEYKQKEYAYKDSVLMCEPNIFIHSSRLYSQGFYDKGLKVLLDAYDKMGPDDRSIGPTAYVISLYYRNHGMRDEEKKYLIVSALSDVKCSVKEYLSLRRLAEILFEEGDYNRSHRYIEQCMSDASFSNARLRMVQVSEVLPVLEGAYQHKLRQKVLALALTTAIIVVLLLILGMLLWQKHKQKIEIDRANKMLSEAGAIKNILLFNLLMESVNRIDVLDNYRRTLNKMALSGDKAGVFSSLRSPDFVDSQWKSFYGTFDSTFLQIVPDFVERVNDLMQPGNKFETQDGKLTVELRILALIRLGIEESERIASILKYSKSTVYSYRSRTRLKATSPDTFEDKIKEISTI